MASLSAVVKGIGRLTQVASRSFLGTLLAMGLLGITLACACYFLLARVHPAYGVLAGVLAFLECVFVGFVLATRRAVTAALVSGLVNERLGRWAVRLTFDHLLGPSAERPPGDAVVIYVPQRVPVERAEAQLEQTQTALARTTPADSLGWIQRRLRDQLLDLVRGYTRVRFREASAAQGSVDLPGIRAELEEQIDDLLAKRLKRAVNRTTLLAVVLLIVQIVGLAALALALLS